MSWTVMIVILVGAVLHASWNVLIKSSEDKILDTAVIHLFCSFIALPFFIAFGLPSVEAWPYLFASCVIHIAYYFALAHAYHHGELGLTYPLMRGAAPLMVAVGSYIFVDDAAISLKGWFGVVFICIGVLVLGLSAGMLQHRRAILTALANAAIIALYTLFDSQGVRLSDHPSQYIAALFALDGWAFALWVFYIRGEKSIDYLKKRWKLAFGGAMASIGSYAIALWAMTVAPVASVAALRETSVLFATLLGAWFFKEKLTQRRMFAVLVIIAGAVMVRLA
ncbi:MAG TPA: phosphonate utilization protein [Alcaligenaceae bacterium]|nr:phosphonate utilization protein [Alcaligenaceae bacterium]